jgi:hypothetical protein
VGSVTEETIKRYIEEQEKVGNNEAFTVGD